MTQAQPHAEDKGSGFEPLAAGVGQVRRSQSTGDGGAEAKSFGFEIGPHFNYLMKAAKACKDEGGGQGTAAGFEPLPATDVGERRWGG